MRVLRAFVELHSKATLWVAADLLGHLVEAVPYKVHIILTESGTHFAVPTGDGRTPVDIKALCGPKVLSSVATPLDAACVDLGM
jgi:hypothetical protein